MAKSRKRRGRKGTVRRRRRARRNYAASGLIANPRRRRRTYRRRRRATMSANPRRRRRYTRRTRAVSRRRRFHRNPGLGSMFGVTLPPLDAVLGIGAGIVIPPVMASFLMGYIPATWKTSKLTYYGVKVASVLLPSMLVKRFVSRRIGNLMLVGGAASLAIDLVNEFAPSLLPKPAAVAGFGAQPFLGFYERMSSRGGGMGRYSSIPVRALPVQRTPLVSMTPERLSPGSRF